MSGQPYVCGCGCGIPTPLATRTDARRGVVAGQPTRFLSGHYVKTVRPLYEERDCGYETPCWVWQRAVGSHGYGSRRDKRFTTSLAHRQFYEERHGPIPDGLVIDHLCRNRRCVNPDHLEPVRQHENAWRGAKTKLTVAQVHEIRRSSGTDRELAPKYGVAPGTIWHVRSGGVQWKDVA